MAPGPEYQSTTEPLDAGPTSPTWPLRVPGVLISLAAFAVFIPSLGHGWTGWDDGAYITASPLMVEPGGLARIWASRDPEQYYPVTFSTFWIEYRLWQRSPLGYHLTNVLLHTLNTFLALVLMRALGVSRWTACVVALFFAVHPLQTMSVAWIAQRKNLLSGCFCLLAALAWVRFRRCGRERWYLASLVAFAMALLSKTAILTFPLALAPLDRVSLRAPLRSTLARVLPMLALAAVGAGMTVLFERPFLEEATIPGLGARSLAAATGILFYVGKLLWPVGLLPIYPPWNVAVTAVIWWVPLALLCITTAAVFRWRHRLDGVVLYGAWHFLMFLLPSLGLVPFGNLAVTYVSDHYVYLACLGFFLIPGSMLARLRRRFARLRNIITGFVGLAVAAAGMLTIRYIPVFENAQSMWTRTLAGHPECFTAYAGLGQFHAQHNDWAQAADCYWKALALKPEAWRVRLALGKALLESGDYRAAEETYEAVADMRPDHPAAVLKLAYLAERTGRIRRSLELYQRAIELDPTNAELHVRLAKVYLGLSRPDEAAEHFRAAIDLDPADPWAYLGLATCQRVSGEARKAVRTLQEGRRRNPQNVALLNLLARVLATDPDDTVRDGPRAVGIARQACALTDYQDPLSLDTLAAAYAEAGEFARAVATAEAAADLAQRQGHPSAARTIRENSAVYQRKKTLRELSTNMTLE